MKTAKAPKYHATHTDIMAERKLFRFIVPLVSLLSAVFLLLPYIKWEAAGLNWSGLDFIKQCFENPSKMDITMTTATTSTVKSIVSVYGIGKVCLLVSLIAAALAALIPLIFHKKWAYQVSAGFSVVNWFSWIFLLFTTAKKLNYLKLCNELFYVSYFKAGFWLAFLFSLLAIILALVASKTSATYLVLVIMSVVWVLPILWVVMVSFRAESGSYTPYFWPRSFTFDNYVQLFTDTEQFFFMRWFGNTLFVAICSCILTTILVLSTAFVFSRLRFPARKSMMNLLLVLGMFPGFMSMIAIYYILKGLGLHQSLVSLVLVYSGGAALSYYIAKGFFDTIPKAMDEAATIDGATKWGIFTKITIPLSKPIIIYTVLTSFTAPWMDFIFAKVIMGDNYKNYTVAIGLWTMLQREFIDKWYTRFAAGAVIVSIPIAILFIIMQRYYVEGLSGSVKG